ncbi:MAG: VWA domain-containing protein [Oscillospiraceae bacterium]|nr:VWA domain-containing protein [Oscillospiraceae bacterium]
MKNFDVSFQYPLRLLLLVPSIALILIPLFSISRKRRTIKKTVPAALHSVLALLLVLAIAGMQFSSVTSKQAVVILVDQSDSVTRNVDTALETAQNIYDAIDDDTDVAAVLFAEYQTTSIGFDETDGQIKPAEGIIQSGTNLENALEYASTLFPQNKAKRIVLVSDGRETEGNSDAAVQYLSNRGIRVDAIHLDTTTKSNEIQVESVKCPAGAHVGEEIPITVTIMSNCKAPVVLRLNKSAYELQAMRTWVEEGENTYEFRIPIEEAGKHTFNVTVSAGEQYNENYRNDIGYCCVNASNSTSILIIANTAADAEPLKQVLSDEYTVIVETFRTTPKTMVELCNYDGIILLNIDLADLPEGYDSMLHDYVEIQGRSLLLCGGGSTFMYGNMVGSAIESILPVDFTVPEQSKGDSVAIMILLDTSLSMAGNYIAMAKAGATKVVEALSSKDYCGLVTFNQFAVLNARLSPVTELFRQQLVESISASATMNQTIYTRPLQMAYSELYNCDAAVRIAVLLSDGGPADKTYSAVAKQMAADGITVSTVGMGFPSTILAALAQDGCGHFSYATTSDDLPEIILGEAEKQSMSAVQLEDTYLVIAEDNIVTEGFTDADLPMVKGIMPVAMKAGQYAWITDSDGTPVYAVSDAGKGKAAVFTSDLTDRWCSSWYESESAKTIIKRMVSTTLSAEPHGSAMTADITRKGKIVSVVLHTAAADVPVTAEIQVSNIHGSHTIQMNAAQKNTYKCSFLTDREGAYDVTFALKDADGNVLDYLNSFFSVDYSDEYDAFSADGRAVLDTLTSQTGGAVSDDLESIASATSPDTVVYYDPILILSALCCIILLADIAIRKLRWADIRGLFVRDS